MYPNVRAEMGRHKMTVLNLSSETGIPYGTLAAKIRGDSEITLGEGLKIKAALKTDLPLEELFEIEPEE